MKVTKIQTPEQLQAAIAQAHFPTHRAFIEAFNAAGGSLNETVLSNQLGGRRGLSAAWVSAYSIFFSGRGIT